MDFFNQVFDLCDIEASSGPPAGADSLGFQSQSSGADFRERVNGQPKEPTTTVAVSSNVTQVANPQANNVLAVHTGSAGLSQPSLIDRAVSSVVHGARNVKRVSQATADVLQTTAKSHGMGA